ncbi:MAG: hypothetical protein GDA52_06365 [Rhodobacteraceae bacterium]|nr:hypothetical protein [Paracoccaceae bacterium]
MLPGHINAPNYPYPTATLRKSDPTLARSNQVAATGLLYKGWNAFMLIAAFA